MLPIYEVEADLIGHLRSGNRLLVSAPPGSGKTTQVPQIMLWAGLLGESGQVAVLQPRRLATRLVAQRVAGEMNGAVGGMVGYQTRHDSRVSGATRIRFLTEGLFLRQLQADPRLPGVAAVILDEFHERSLAADASLALLARAQETVRPDLKVIVMSATLEVERVSRYLGCPVVTAGGRSFEVEVRYLRHRSDAPSWELAAGALAEILDTQQEGDVLIFMPGGYEIRRTLEACRAAAGGNGTMDFFPLHGELPAGQQDAALRPSPRRKVIVSTNVAETSITIEGIRHVVDSGLARINRFDPRRGINVLLVEPISQSSAEQRAGRAGRTAPGTCHRLWTDAQQRSRPGHDTPEVLRLELAEVVLQLKAMGVAEISTFPWLDPPPAAAIDQAQGTLQRIDALDAGGQLTALGRTMANFPMHPRLSRMLAEAARRKCLERAVLWAALLADRDILMHGAAGGGEAIPGRREGRGVEHSRQRAQDFTEPHRSDFLVLERAFESAVASDFDPARCAALGVHASACRQAQQTRRQYLQICAELFSANRKAAIGASEKVVEREKNPAEAASTRHPRAWGKRYSEVSIDNRQPTPAEDHLDDLLRCLLVAYPDHVAVRRSPDKAACALVGQRRGTLDRASIAQRAGLLLAVDIRELTGGPRDSGGVKTVLSLASEIKADWLREVHPERVRVRHVTQWNDEKGAVERVEQHVFDDLVFDETARPETDLGAAAGVLSELIFKGQLKLEHWDEAVEQWIARTRCVAQWFPERHLLPYDDDDRRVILAEICAGAVRYSQIKDRDCLGAVKGALSWEDQEFVERMAPERLAVPGSAKWRMKVEYQPGSPPRGRAKIQDLFGLKQSPTVAGGRQKVLLEILAPNYRPVQTTDDLAGFWKNLYPTLKKEFARKYPRHEWR